MRIIGAATATAALTLLAPPAPPHGRPAFAPHRALAPRMQQQPPPPKPADTSKDWGGLPAAIAASQSGALNNQLVKATDAEGVLALIAQNGAKLSSVNVATALHRLAGHLKRDRARRDAVLRDSRFLALIDATIELADKLSPRSVSDVMWGCATLQHWPPTMLKPVLTQARTHRAAPVRRRPRATPPRAAPTPGPPAAATAAGRLPPPEVRIRGAAPLAHPLVLCGPRVQAGAPAARRSGASRAPQRRHARPPARPVQVRLLEMMEASTVKQLGAFNRQNCANVLWGFAKLNHRPTALMPCMCDRLIEPEFLDGLKPVEVADTAYALSVLGTAESEGPLLEALAARAEPETLLERFSSRQLVTMVGSFARFERRPAQLGSWLEQIERAHARQPLLGVDRKSLEAALGTFGEAAEWLHPPKPEADDEGEKAPEPQSRPIKA